MSAEYKYTETLCRKVTDHVSAMLAYWDKDLVCRFANAAYLQWFGKCQEEMVDKITMQDLLGKELFDENLPYIKMVLSGKKQTFERAIPIPGSTEKRASLANYYPDIVDGEVKGFIVHVADVSTMKSLHRELEGSFETITKQNQGLLNFSNIVSHNLKSYSNNLAAILTLYNEAESATEKKEYFDMLLTISKGFSATVEHLNEVVKMQHDDSLKLEEIKLYDYIEMIIQILQVQVKASGATILNKINKEATINANPAYMESILLNLLTNAIKYKHPQRNPVIEIYCSSVDNKSIISIKDNGLGINLAKHGKDLFGIYKTFHKHPDSQGIGLFITKYQAEAMGAKIDVQSQENEGSTFSVVFNNPA
ncbi:MAG: ATP-binding protein [Bacteroidia bacterium]